MHTQITFKALVSPMVLLLVLAVAGCNRGHNDNVQDNGADHLPMRLQLPKDDSPEAFRIVQYAADDVTRKVQQSVLKKGPYAGGRELRVYDDDNGLAEIAIFFPVRPGQPEQPAYIATFSNGFYRTERSFTADGTRASEGQRQPDGTFEQSTFFSGGTTVYKHAVFGRLMNDDQKLVWKVLSDEINRNDGTVGAVQQLMDDGSVFSQFYDEHHFLTENLYVDKSGAAKNETDFDKDGKTPILRYDFADKTAYYFDNKGVVSLSRKWGYDDSQELTYFKDGVPTFTQHWEVDSEKSDRKATPVKLVYFLSWVKQLRPDMTVSWQVNYWTGTSIVQTIDIPESAPADAKYNTSPVPAPAGSTTPARNWTPPAKAAGTSTSSTSGSAVAPSAVSLYFKPSGAHQTYSYSPKGFLTKVESFKAGKWEADTTVTHKESEHIRARVNPGLLKPLPAGERPSDKPKDPTPAQGASWSFDPDDF